MSDSNPDLYPNATDDSPTHWGLSRRRMLASSAAVGVATTAGCLGDDETDDGDEQPNVEDRPTVFVFNTGDGTVSTIDVESDGVVATESLGLTSSFPSNQFTPELTGDPGDPLWLNVGQGVRALTADSLTEEARVETGSGANWQEQTPDGSALVVSAREPAHTQFRLDADPDSETFGEVTAELDRGPEGGRGDNDGPGPCDVTIHPDGEYAYVPDLFGDTLTVLDVDAFEIEAQIEAEPVDGDPSAPWMGTVARNGETLIVEHNSGTAGSESIWDLADPARPTKRAHLTPGDGLGEGPLTSEVDPDAEYGYVFTPDTDDVTVLDLAAGTVEKRLDLGGSAFTGTWGPAREKLYVPVQTEDEVAVVDSTTREITTTIDVGSEPYGATAARIRPAPDAAVGTETQIARFERLASQQGTSYCIGNCACGHELE